MSTGNPPESNAGEPSNNPLTWDRWLPLDAAGMREGVYLWQADGYIGETTDFCGGRFQPVLPSFDTLLELSWDQIYGEVSHPGCSWEPSSAFLSLDGLPALDDDRGWDLAELESAREVERAADAAQVAGHVAMFSRLLDDAGKPILSRVAAGAHNLLPEWDRLGHLCVCRDVLPPMPRWFLPNATAEEDLDLPAPVAPVPSVQFVSVEFADGFTTVVQRDELVIYPRHYSSRGESAR